MSFSVGEDFDFWGGASPENGQVFEDGLDPLAPQQDIIFWATTCTDACRDFMQRTVQEMNDMRRAIAQHVDNAVGVTRTEVAQFVTTSLATTNTAVEQFVHAALEGERTRNQFTRQEVDTILEAHRKQHQSLKDEVERLHAHIESLQRDVAVLYDKIA